MRGDSRILQYVDESRALLPRDRPREWMDRNTKSVPTVADDSLELEGVSLADWGWKITCLNCDWEMKLAESSGYRPVHVDSHAGSEVQSRIDQPDDGDARNHQPVPCGVGLPPAQNAARARGLQFARVQQGCLAEGRGRNFRAPRTSARR